MLLQALRMSSSWQEDDVYRRERRLIGIEKDQRRREWLKHSAWPLVWSQNWSGTMTFPIAGHNTKSGIFAVGMESINSVQTSIRY